MVLRKVVPSALLSENQIVIEGERRERLPEGRVYVSPTTHRVYDGAKGDTLSELPPDAVEVDKTTWYVKLLRKGPKAPDPIWQRGIDEGTLPEDQIAVEDVGRIRSDYLAMHYYFPDFELLYDDCDHSLLWNGSIEGVGQAVIRYVSEESCKVLLPDMPESQNVEMNQYATGQNVSNTNPVGALIVALRYLLTKRVNGDGLASNSTRESET